MPDLCTAVTKRGPCEVLTADMPFGTLQCDVEYDRHSVEGAHDYLGPVLARCGHEEGRHRLDSHAQLYRSDPAVMCWGCWHVDSTFTGMCWHEFTTEEKE